MRVRELFGVAAMGSIAWACAHPPSEARGPKTLIVAPLNFNQTLPEALAPGIPVLQAEIESFLEARGARVVAPPLAEFHDSWLASARDLGSLYDQAGSFDPDRFDQAAASLARAYAARIGTFDALILPYLDVTHVTIRGGNASWDGVRRRVRIRYRENAGDNAGSMLSLGGIDTPCTSLRVLAYVPSGARLFEQRRGLEVLHHYRVDLSSAADTNLGAMQVLPRDDLFRDQRLLNDAVRIAFEPLFDD